MKKHFMFMMAVLMGLIISLGSCNNSSKKSSDDDDEENSEKTDKKKGKKSSKKESKSKKSAKSSDTYEEEDWDYDDDDDDYGSGSKSGNNSYDDDDDDFDFDDIDDIDDLKDLDVNSLTSEQANKVLQLICEHADEFIGDSGQDISMSMRGSDVVITTSLDMSAQGATPQLFQTVLDTPEMKNKILGEMFEDSDAKEVAKVIVKANKNLLMQFYDTATGGSASTRFTRSDLTRYTY